MRPSSLLSVITTIAIAGSALVLGGCDVLSEPDGPTREDFAASGVSVGRGRAKDEPGPGATSYDPDEDADLDLDDERLERELRALDTHTR